MIRRWQIEEWRNRVREAVARRIAWCLPRRVAMWATIRVWANATTGAHSSVEAPACTVSDALARWRV
jgi:hypothetical protein